MKPNEAEKLEKAKVGFLAAQTKKQGKPALLSLLSFVIILILPGFISPPFGIIVQITGAATFLSLFIALDSNLYRSRNGSLKQAIYLVAAMWVAAIVIIVLSLARFIR